MKCKYCGREIELRNALWMVPEGYKLNNRVLRVFGYCDKNSKQIHLPEVKEDLFDMLYERMI